MRLVALYKCYEPLPYSLTALTNGELSSCGCSARCILQTDFPGSGVNGLVTSGGWIDAKGKVSWGGSHPVGSRGQDPIGGLVYEMDVKLIFYEGKIENAYVSRCFLKRTHAAVLSAVQLTIRIGEW